MRFLFIKDSLAWPRSSGHDVHTFYMMQALARLGHTVSLATIQPLNPQAVMGSGLECTFILEPETGDTPIPMTKWQEKFRSYWGIDQGMIRSVGSLSKGWCADVVVVVGLNVLPYLAMVQNAKRVWYAGDEWFWHHVSLMSIKKPHTWKESKNALITGLYERVYARMLDRVWMVSEPDRKAMRWVTGFKNTDVLPNGIDCNHYRPGTEAQIERSCVFWGRLDFLPNIQGLEWFCSKVWPRVQRAEPGARFTIYGFQPSEAVMKLAQPGNGIEIIPNLPDIRSSVRQHPVVVLPFVSGGGIKNKLLEAAAMGKAIVASKRAASGLTCGNALVQADNPSQWVQSILSLWRDAPQRAKLGEAARQWVLADHTWEAAAKKAAAGLESSMVEVRLS